jgi:DNA-directed RNA polymerase delta subunit
MDIVHNILQNQGRPLHVNEIIVLAQKRFNIRLDKESLVSAITKRIKRHDRFVKIGPNTFGLLTRPLEEER